MRGVSTLKEGRVYQNAVLRLRGILGRATTADLLDGEGWYPTARLTVRKLAEALYMSWSDFAGIVAALSPGLAWDRNLIRARDLVLWHQKRTTRKPRIETYSRLNVEKATAILKGAPPEDVLRGDKVVPFYLLLSEGGGEENSVVLDGHMANILRGECGQIRGSKTISPIEQRAWERAVRVVASERGMLPSTVQATVWLTHRREKKE